MTTFSQQEKSISSGKPIRLYLFKRGFTSWGYCSSSIDIIFASVVYRSSQITDDGIRQSGEPTADAFEITAPGDLAVAQLYRGLGPSKAIDITVYDMHYGGTEAVIKFIGTVYGVSWPAEDRCKIVCQSDEAGMAQTGLRMTWSRGCEHTWGEVGCNVNRDIYKLETTIQSLTGAAISSGDFATKPDGWFDGGYIEWPVGGGVFDQRSIESHIGSTLTLLGGAEGLGLNQSITAFPGCARIAQVCNDKFNNITNYSGVPHLPGIDLFGANPIF